MTIQDQPSSSPANVNLEMVKMMRVLLGAAERGQITSLLVLACKPDGGPIQGMFVADQHISILNTLMDVIKGKFVGKLISAEIPGAPSPIIKPGAFRVE